MNRQAQFDQLIENFQSIKRSMLEQHDFNKDGIPFGQKTALFVIALHDSINVKQLAKALHVTSGAATQHVEALVQAGLTERSTDPDDRRTVVIKLSPKGVKLFKKLRRDRLSRLESLFSEITDEELETYNRVMGKVIKNIDSRGTV